MAPTKTRLLVVDAMNLVFRAHYALIRRPLRTTDGRNTSALFGFARMLAKALADYAPTHVAVAFEGAGPSFRDKLYPAYKATRKAPPDELVAQLPPIKEFVRDLGLALLEHAGMEADDVVATLARGGAGPFDEVLILSGDKDLMALVGPRVRMLVPQTGVSALEEMDAAGVEAKLGVPPAAVPDLLALMGDAVDNIPGVRGVGEKGARALLADFGSLAGVYKNLDTIANARLRAALAEGREVAELSRRLATLADDLKLGVRAAELAPRARDERRLRAMVRDYELKTLGEELALGPPAPDEVAAAAATVSRADFPPGVDAAPAWRGLEVVERGGAVAGVVVAGTAGAAETFEGTAADVAARVAAAHERSALPLAAHDTKRVVHILGPGVVFDGDTFLGGYLLNPERVNYALDDLAFEYLKTTLAPAAAPADRLDFGEGALEAATERARAVAALAAVMERILAGQGMDELWRRLEVPLAPVLAAVEQRGVRIDVPHFRRLGKKFDAALAQEEAELYRLAGGEFNPNSPIQLRHILFEKLGLKPKRKTKTGYSTAADVLEQLAEDHELPARVLAYRELAKLKNTYVDVLPTLVDADDRVHTTFNQAGTSTGRLSSTDPNLQNIPIRTELGAEIRRGFIPAGGTVFLSADYAQVELRILAHVADDPGLQAAFAQGKDIHAATAAEIFDRPFDQVTRDQRAVAKAINFGLAYKMGPARLAREAGLALDDARRYIERYFERYPGVRRFIAEQVERAQREGYVHTILGRRRYLPDIQSPDNRARAAAERVAVNMPIQGSAADILKLAMVALERRLAAEKGGARMVLTIHDELLFEVPPGAAAAKAGAAIREEMAGVVALKVPLEVHVGTGANWLEAHG